MMADPKWNFFDNYDILFVIGQQSTKRIHYATYKKTVSQNIETESVTVRNGQALMQTWTRSETFQNVCKLFVNPVKSSST